MNQHLFWELHIGLTPRGRVPVASTGKDWVLEETQAFIWIGTSQPGLDYNVTFG